MYITLTILLGVVAVNTGNNLLYLFVSILLGFMGISGFFGKKNLEGIDIEIVVPEEVYAKTPFDLKVYVKNRKRFLPSFLLKVSIKDRDILLPTLDRLTVKSAEINWICEKRGIDIIGGIYLSSVFPFNFFVRYKTIRRETVIVVFPELKRGKINTNPKWRGKIKDGVEKTTFGLDEEITSLRDYVPGDPIRFIHWKASAKVDHLKIKNLGSAAFKPPIIDFSKVPIQDIEERLKVVTYAIVEARKRKSPIGLSINGKMFEPTVSKSKILSMLKELALYENV